MAVNLRPERTHSELALLVNPYVGFSSHALSVDPSADIQALYWRSIQSLVALESSRPSQLQSGGSSKAIADFGGYIRQGYDFWLASRNTPTPTNAVLLYYSVLQLAKAELLIHCPDVVLGRQMRHGISTIDLDAETIEGVSEKPARSGVFVELVKSRTGKKVSMDDRWTLHQLMSAFPDSRWELAKAGHTSACCMFVAYLAANDSEIWLSLDFQDDQSILLSPRIQELLKQHGLHLRAANRSNRAKSATGYSHRLETDALPREGSGALSAVDYDQMNQQLLPILQPFLGVAPFGQPELGFLPTSGTPIAPPLARYLCLHLLSSLVRYSPGLLQEPQNRWLAEAFLNDSITPMLQSAYMYLSGERLLYRTDRRSHTVI